MTRFQISADTRFAAGRMATRLVLLAFATVVSLNVAAIRWQVTTVGVAQEAANGPAAEPFDLSYVPRDAIALFAARPSTLLDRPALAQVRESLVQLTDDGPLAGLKPTDVDQLRAVVLGGANDRANVAVGVRTSSAEAAARLTAFLGEPMEATTYGGIAYARTSGGVFFFQPDEFSFVMAPDIATLHRCIAAGKAGAASTDWAERWAAVATRDAAAVVNTSLLRGTNGQPVVELLSELPLYRSNRDRSQLMQTAFRVAPLWQKSEWAVAELQVAEQITLRAVSQSASAEEAVDVHGALLTSVSLARLALSSGRQAVAEQTDARGFAMLQQLDLLDQLLEKAQIVRQDSQVGLIARADAGLANRLIAMIVPAGLAAREASQRQRSFNNLKQIALAFHNYHDVYKTFPAATQIGPKNVPHSWRVTILPFLESASLYEKYRQDEPWDSENNQTVLAAMPDVYRFPGDDKGSTNTSYFTIVGPGTVFESDRTARLAQITDGSSNTILAVESKRPIPWTKPDDIPYDVQQPLPTFGGWYEAGFCVAMCDGSSRFIPADFDPSMLQFMIMRGDGNPIRFPE